MQFLWVFPVRPVKHANQKSEFCMHSFRKYPQPPNFFCPNTSSWGILAMCDPSEFLNDPRTPPRPPPDGPTRTFLIWKLRPPVTVSPLFDHSYPTEFPRKPPRTPQKTPRKIHPTPLKVVRWGTQTPHLTRIRCGPPRPGIVVSLPETPDTFPDDHKPPPQSEKHPPRTRLSAELRTTPKSPLLPICARFGT